MLRTTLMFWYFFAEGIKIPGFLYYWFLLSAICSGMILLFSDWKTSTVVLAVVLGTLIASLALFFLGGAVSRFAASLRK